MKKKRRSIFGTLIVVVMTLGLSVSQATAIELRFGHTGVQGGYIYLVGEKFKENIEKLSGGDIIVTVFPNSQLGGNAEMLGQCKKGSLDFYMSDYIAAAFGAKSGKPFFVGFSPFLYRDQEHLNKFVASTAFKEMMGAVENEAGIKWLGLLGDRSPRALTTRHKMVIMPDDLKGLKIRTPRIPSIMETFKGWGASISVLSVPELYNGLKQKMVDGQDNGIEWVTDFKLYEVQKYYIAIDYIRSALGVWLNMEKWNSLNPTQQEVINKSTLLTREWANPYLREKVILNGYELLRQKGVTVVIPPLKAWIESTQKVVNTLDGEMWPKGLYEKIQKIK